MSGVSDNEEAPAIQIARTKVAMRDGHRENIWGWGLEVTDDEEGRRVAERLGDFDWSMVRAAMLEGCTDGPQHRLDMEEVGPV